MPASRGLHPFSYSSYPLAPTPPPGGRVGAVGEGESLWEAGILGLLWRREWAIKQYMVFYRNEMIEILEQRESNIILEAVLLRSVCHKFCIQLALPISPEIMDGF